MDAEQPAPARSTGPLAEHIAAVCDRFVPRLPPGSAHDALLSVRAGLTEPLRVAVTGRVNAGKSTLVNALLGQRVAPTDVSECTRYVTWYRFGVPERLEIVRRDGSRDRRALRADGSMPTELDADRDIRHLEVFLGNDTLRTMTVIDTPGLASSSGRSSDTGELLALDVASRLAVAQADAVLYAVTARTVVAEAKALEAFREMTTGTLTTALNAVGVLSRADQLDSDDPVGSARDIAATISKDAAGALGAVVSVVGLLAETAECGLLTEAAAAALGRVAALDDASLDRLLLSTDRFVRADIGADPAALMQLLERLDLFGIAHAVELFRIGVVTASQLVPELRKLAGYDELLALLDRTFAANADALKAAAALSALERVAYSGMGSGPLRQDLLDAIEEVQLDPAMHRLAELRAWLACRRGDVDLPADLEREVTATLAVGAERGARPNAGAVPAEAEQAALDGINRWRTVANDPSASGATRSVAEVMVRSLEQVWVAIRGTTQ